MQIAERRPIKLYPDLNRVLCRYLDLDKLGRSRNILERIKSIPETLAKEILTEVLQEFETRHRDIEGILHNHYSIVASRNQKLKTLSAEKQLLLGAYYSHEYTLESAAFMNPSIVVFTDLGSHEQDECPFIMSLRSVGEGHISSVEFRTGKIKVDGSIYLDPITKITNAGNHKIISKNGMEATELYFEGNTSLSENIIFPMTEDECNGIEDVRFVRFETGVYYGTYSAYDGYKITLKLIETRDFKSFYIQKLMDGSFSHKGIALFPRKVGGKYLMTSRQDGENLYIMYSDDILKWEQADKIMEPKEPWEFIQLGNCGSPLEIDQGWILITHGVGPMRKYVLSACLLDKNDPSKVTARLDQPLLSPLESERSGYVPNVVYSCGAMLHKNDIYIPYAMSDYATSFASISVDKLLNHMQ